MYLLPAIDLKGGQCVRLRRGDMSQATVFNTSAGQQARSFAREGAEWIHIVDLDGAFAGSPVNVAAVEDILKSADVKTELGGGIRSLDVVKMWLDKGVERVILGTQALRDPDFVKRACDMFPHRIAVGIDAKDGKVAVEGWADYVPSACMELYRTAAQLAEQLIRITAVFFFAGVCQKNNIPVTVHLAAAGLLLGEAGSALLLLLIWLAGFKKADKKASK